MNVTNQQERNSMKAVYIRRRIAVAVLLIALAVQAFALFKLVSKPAFECKPAEVRLGHQMIWNIADQYCSGDITLAAKKIMEDNNIEGKDLRGLLPSTVIIIKGGN